MIGLSCRPSRFAAKRLGNTSWQLETWVVLQLPFVLAKSSAPIFPPPGKFVCRTCRHGAGKSCQVSCRMGLRLRPEGTPRRPELTPWPLSSFCSLLSVYLFSLSSIRHSHPPQSLRRLCLRAVGSPFCPLGSSLSESGVAVGNPRFPTSPAVRCRGCSANGPYGQSLLFMLGNTGKRNPVTSSVKWDCAAPRA